MFKSMANVLLASVDRNEVCGGTGNFPIPNMIGGQSESRQTGEEVERSNAIRSLVTKVLVPRCRRNVIPPPQAVSLSPRVSLV